MLPNLNFFDSINLLPIFVCFGYDFVIPPPIISIRKENIFKFFEHGNVVLLPFEGYYRTLSGLPS